MRLLDQIGWESKGTKEVYAITLASDDIRGIFLRLLGQALQIVKEPPVKSDQVLARATNMAEIARMVLQELPGGTRRPLP